METTDITGIIRQQLQLSKSVICDGQRTLQYSDIGQILGHSPAKKVANALPIRNTVAHVVQLISHVLNRQNFLVLNGSVDVTYSKENLTTFCENVLYHEDRDVDSRDILSSFVSRPNPFYRHGSPALTDADSFFILRTSGTTNQPKFVLHAHNVALQNSKRCSEKIGLTAEDRVLIPVSIHHSYGLVTALFPSLIAGASIRLVSNTNIVKLMDAISSFHPTVMFATPGLVEMVLRVKSKKRISKITISAGDRIGEDLFRKYETEVGRIANLYGSTEMGAMALSDVTQDLGIRSGGDVYAIDGVSFKVKKKRGELSAIFCKHDSGFLTYLDYQGRDLQGRSSRPEWFDTKDIGMILGGAMRILGRADQKVNRNGVLISFFEVESAIERVCTEVGKVVVVKLAKNNMIGTQIAAICELKEGADTNANEIRRRCIDNLDRPIIPDIVMVIPTMPLLPSGKVDRKLLQAEYGEVSEAAVPVLGN